MIQIIGTMLSLQNETERSFDRKDGSRVTLSTAKARVKCGSDELLVDVEGETLRKVKAMTITTSTPLVMVLSFAVSSWKTEQGVEREGMFVRLISCDALWT